MESGNGPRPLTPAERDRLRRWERRMITVFVVSMALLAATVLWPFGAHGQRMVFAILLVVVGGSVLIQFSAACPRCGARLGLQTRLLLPRACKKCGVALRE